MGDIKEQEESEHPGEALLAGPSEMGARLSWTFAALFALVAFSNEGYGAESPNAIPDAEDDPGKRDLETLRIPRTTQRQRSRMTAYRTGSLSALSRGLMSNLSAPGGKERGEKARHERGASENRGLCWGRNRTLLPSRTGSGEGDSSKEQRSSQKSLDSGSLEMPFSPPNITEDSEQQKASGWLTHIKRRGQKRQMQHFQAT